MMNFISAALSPIGLGSIVASRTLGSVVINMTRQHHRQHDSASMSRNYLITNINNI
jgi:hypothetical protein